MTFTSQPEAHFVNEQQVAEQIEKGEPVTAPGVLTQYPDAKKLVTGDCIKPQLAP